MPLQLLLLPLPLLLLPPLLLRRCVSGTCTKNRHRRLQAAA
jgi:hypothetical protein